VLALRGNSLAFSSHPTELVRLVLVRWLLRLARVRGRFLGWISVRVHPDRTSFD
jgi:hypothetical protein